MPLLTPLLDVQGLDLACDRLGLERAKLPARAAILEAQAAIERLAGAHGLLVERRRALAESEHGLGAEVAAVAARAKGVETTLYSGTVRVSKELTALQEEIRLFRVRQSELETRELELLEEIEQAEREMAGNRAEDSRVRGDMKSLTEALAVAEAAIDTELAKLTLARQGLVASLPSEILTTYERLRSRERLVGRAAAPIVDGGCSGCHMKLPVLEYNRMKSKPEDALLLCIHCGRILVR
ncbi:hypothetical protein K2X89_14830 [Myxococcota bacterium]|nr:hypothetical protein [Myxococcota bacterium]